MSARKVYTCDWCGVSKSTVVMEPIDSDPVRRGRAGIEGSSKHICHDCLEKLAVVWSEVLTTRTKRELDKRAAVLYDSAGDSVPA